LALRQLHPSDIREKPKAIAEAPACRGGGDSWMWIATAMPAKGLPNSEKDDEVLDEACRGERFRDPCNA
jgi:hypothetical protein